MKKVWLLGLVMLTLVGLVSAESCFTAVNAPQADTLYWKTITYTGILDGNYQNFLTKPNIINPSPDIGAGYQYTMRLDSDCFNGYLLNNLDSSGIKSSQINLQTRDNDYYTDDFISNKLYTLSISEKDDISTGIVSQITTGTVDGIDYLKLPDSFKTESKHPLLFKMLNDGLCDSSLKVTKQLDEIKLAIWKKLDPGELGSCNLQNTVDCALEQEKGESLEYASLGMVLARQCGIPARVVYGISEGSFDGIDIVFPREKMHYWVEFYDGQWFEKDFMEGGTSVPENIELNCFDNQDNDLNGYTDCSDKACEYDAACSSWVTSTNYDNKLSTDLTKLSNPYNVNDLTLANEHGSVTWTNQKLDLRGMDLDTAVSISPNLLNINSNHPVLDVKATAKLLNVEDEVKITRNSVSCNACKIISNKNGTIKFTIPGAGRYATKVMSKNISKTPAIDPSKDMGQGNFFDKITNTWNRLNKIGKITVIVMIVFLLWLYFKRKNKRKLYYNRG